MSRVLDRFSALFSQSAPEDSHTIDVAAASPTLSPARPTRYDQDMLRAIGGPHSCNLYGSQLPPELILVVTEFCSRHEITILCRLHSSWRGPCQDALYSSILLAWDTQPDRVLSTLRTLSQPDTTPAASVRSLAVIVPNVRWDARGSTFRTVPPYTPYNVVSSRPSSLLCQKCTKSGVGSCRKTYRDPLPVDVVSHASALAPGSIRTDSPLSPLRYIPDNVLHELSRRPPYPCQFLYQQNIVLLWTTLLLALRRCRNIERLALPQHMSRSALDEQVLFTLATRCLSLRALRIPVSVLSEHMHYDDAHIASLQPSEPFSRLLRTLASPASDRPGRLLIVDNYDRDNRHNLDIDELHLGGLHALSSIHRVSVVLLDPSSTQLDILPALYAGEQLRAYLRDVVAHTSMLVGESGHNLQRVCVRLQTNQLGFLRPIMEALSSVILPTGKPLQQLSLLFVLDPFRDAALGSPSDGAAPAVDAISANAMYTRLLPLHGVQHIQFCQTSDAGAGNVFKFSGDELIQASRRHPMLDYNEELKRVSWSGIAEFRR